MKRSSNTPKSIAISFRNHGRKKALMRVLTVNGCRSGRMMLEMSII
jgi:hypothetical protein